MLTPETILQGRYRIVRQLGKGGMGTVYEAVDQRLRNTVAIKETLFTDERLRKQFEREAELLASLHHPALPNVSDHFIEGDGQFLVMQFIRGADVAEMLEKRGTPFSTQEVLGWGDQLLDALDYLHTQETPIIHRDIKPQNLKLTARGQIILLDFGLAKGVAGMMSRITTTGSIFGFTPNFAPLEQIQGTGTGPHSDLYSLAATLYHLMTNVVPIDALSRASSIIGGMGDPLLPANEVNPQVSASVAAVIQKGMGLHPSQRYPTASEMRQALKGASRLSEASAPGAKTLVLPAQTVAASHEPTEELSEQNTIVTAPVALMSGASEDKPTSTLKPSMTPVEEKRRLNPVLALALTVIVGVIIVGAIIMNLDSVNSREPDSVFNTNATNTATTSNMSNTGVANANTTNRSTNMGTNMGSTTNSRTVSNTPFSYNMGNTGSRNMGTSNANRGTGNTYRANVNTGNYRPSFANANRPVLTNTGNYRYGNMNMGNRRP
ncbi:MAG: serine/threonine protein kinase [Pyrinomonadaceae bacterium]|nr:serine/threonine protein kinase [Pyrinomonadaceae bacterium]